MTSDDAQADAKALNPAFQLIEGGGSKHHPKSEPIIGMDWTLNVLHDLKLAAEDKGFPDIANEIEVAYQRVQFLLNRKPE